MVHFSEKKHPYRGVCRFSTKLIVLPTHTRAIAPNLKLGTLPRTHHHIIEEIQPNRNTQSSALHCTQIATTTHE